MDYLYSLYDALISINVPTDKARAVVDAMERDMGTTIATKADLQLLKQELKIDTQSLRQELKNDMQSLRNELMSLISGLATRDEMRDQMAAIKADIHKDMALLSTSMTVRLGSMLMVGLGVLFAALKLA